MAYKRTFHWGLNVALLASVVMMFYMLGAVLAPRLGAWEGQLFPVSAVTTMVFDEVDGHAVVSGTFSKLRACQFIRTEWYKGSGVQIEIKRLDEAHQLPVGDNVWGRVELEVSAETARTNIYAIAYHSCHPLWDTITKTLDTRSNS